MAVNLRSRVKHQLNALKLMKGIQRCPVGARQLVVGEFDGKRGQQVRKCLPLIEHVLIRHYLAKGDNLLNIKGTAIANHELVSNRKDPLTKVIPRRILIE